MKARRTLAILILSTPVMMLAPAAAEAGLFSKVASRIASRLFKKAATKAPMTVLRRDLIRDLRAPVRFLRKTRSVFRYTTSRQARAELSRGISPGSHMTSAAKAGRPLNPLQAQKRYGLPQRPSARELITLRTGQPVRIAKVIGGGRGLGEISSPRGLPRSAVKKVIPLRPARASNAAAHIRPR